MKNQAIPLIIDQVKWKQLTVAVAGSVIIPVIVHLIPIQTAVPLGAMLLPIFLAPMLAVLFSKPYVGFLAALLAPVLNHFITGMPSWELLPVMTIELLVFTVLISFFRNNRYLIWIAGPLGYLLAKGFSGFLLWLMPFLLPSAEPAGFIRNSISNGLPGIALLLIISLAVGFYGKRHAGQG